LESQLFLPEEVWFEKLPNPFDFWRRPLSPASADYSDLGLWMFHAVKLYVGPVLYCSLGTEFIRNVFSFARSILAGIMLAASQQPFIMIL